MKKITLCANDLVSRYDAGQSVNAIGKALSVSRSVVRNELVRAGVKPRTRSEAGVVRMQSLSPAERKRLASAAHDAARGRTKTVAEMELKARTIERIGKSSKYEIAFGKWLADRGIEFVPQLAIGMYNVDIGINSSRIAVEIFGGNWHSTGRHAARYRSRMESLLGAGWLPVIIWCGRDFGFSEASADYVAAIHEIRCSDKTVRCQEHVIRGDCKTTAAARVNRYNGALVLGSSRS